MSRKLLALTLLLVCVLALPGPLAAQTPTAGQIVTGTAPAQSLTLPPNATGDVRLTILNDSNKPVDSRLEIGRGFAALVEYGSHTLLFDTGSPDATLLDNMKRLGVDPRSIEAVVLSYSDQAHVGGLQGLLDTGVQPTIYAPSTFSDLVKDPVRSRTKLIEVTDPVEIVPGVHTTRVVDSTEQALVVETRDGTLVIVGCAVPGVVKMVRAAQEVVGGQVALLAGGFHLSGTSKSELPAIVAELRQLGVQGILPCHCTGYAATDLFRTEYGANYIAGGAGRTVTMPVAAPPAAAQAPVRVLFVGDCHSWFLDTYFPKLAASGDPPIIVQAVGCSLGGYDLTSLWSTARFSCPEVKALQAGEGQWDFGVIVDGYYCKGPNAHFFTDAAPKFNEAFRKAGAQIVLTAPWPDQHDNDTVPEYIAVADGVAAQLSARVSPVALAVDRVRRERPGLIEYVDEYHVNAQGWYLQMCVHYATLFGRSPEGLKYRFGDIEPFSQEGQLWNLYKLPAGWALADADAAYLQRVAWETVQEHQSQK